MDSPELKSLNKCYPALVLCVQQAPNDIADQLRSLGLLPQGVLSTLRSSQKNDVEKAREIVDTMVLQVQTDSGVFQSFIQALSAAGSWTKSAVDELLQKFHSYSVLPLNSATSSANISGESQQPPPLQYTGSSTNALSDSSSDKGIPNKTEI